MLRAEIEANPCQTIEQKLVGIVPFDVALNGNKFYNLDDVQNATSIYFIQKPIDFYWSAIENLHTR